MWWSRAGKRTAEPDKETAMKVRMTIKGAVMVAALAGAAVSIAAHAQQSGGVLIDERGNVVREAPRPTETISQTVTQSRSESTMNDGKNVVKVTVENGVAKISLNGKEIAERPMDDTWSSEEVLDESGEVVAKVYRRGDHVVIGDESMQAMNLERDAMRQAQRAYGVAIATQPAKVMMGITMGFPSQETAEQLGIKREEATLVTSVRDDLPAAAAGLKVFDVIVSVDGQKPAPQDVIRTVLREKEPGDELAFGVLRRGEAKDITIKLEAYDAARLGEPSWSEGSSFFGQGSAPAAPMPFFEYRNMYNERAEELRTQMGELSARMAEMSARLSATAGEEAEKLGKELAEVGSEVSVIAKQLAEEMAQQAPRLRGEILRFQGQVGDQLREMLVVPPAPAAPSMPGVPGVGARADAELRAQNEALKAQIEAMKADRDLQQKAFEERMAKLEQMMQKIAEGKSGN